MKKVKVFANVHMTVGFDMPVNDIMTGNDMMDAARKMAVHHVGKLVSLNSEKKTGIHSTRTAVMSDVTYRHN